MVRTSWSAMIVEALTLAACARPAEPLPAPSAGQPSQDQQADRSTAPRTLAAAVRLEPPSLALRPLQESFANVDYIRLFNADIAFRDDRAMLQPYLVEALPQLST